MRHTAAMLDRLIVTTLFAAALTACGGAPTTDPAAHPPAPDTPPLAIPATAPPFDAAAIRAATAPGRTYVHRSTQPGMPPVTMLTRFVTADDAGATIEVMPLDAAGQPAAAARKAKMTWADFESHGVPKPGTMQSEGPCTVPAGTFDCIYFEIATPDGRRRDGFARSLPGMPVLSEVEADGAWVRVMELVEHRPGG